MKFELLRDQEKARTRAATRRGAIEFKPSEGMGVCYRQPLYEQSLSGLAAAIHRSDALEKLRGRFYKIESNGGYLHRYYPAVEYYKIAHRMILDNTHTIRLSLEEIETTQKAIEAIYRKNRKEHPTGQTELSFDKEVYRLRASIFTFVFSVRATLDTVASLFQTIYSPQIGQHTSFNGLMSHITSGKSAIKDDTLANHLSNNMEWFVLLKDIRDYLAHFGAVEFSIKEINSTTLCIEMFNGIEINAFIKAIYTGFNELLVFLDNHCSSVVLDAENAEAI